MVRIIIMVNVDSDSEANLAEKDDFKNYKTCSQVIPRIIYVN